MPIYQGVRPGTALRVNKIDMGLQSTFELLRDDTNGSLELTYKAYSTGTMVNASYTSCGSISNCTTETSRGGFLGQVASRALQ